MDDIAKILNDNQGVLSVLIFVITIFLGWSSGIFATLRKKPKLRIKLIDGPSLCCTFETGEKRNDYAVHRTAISLYLNIANVGSAATSIENVAVGYHWHLRPSLTLLWVKYRVFWFWLHNQTTALEDFQIKIGERVKVYPSLFQGSPILGQPPKTYLEVGQSVNGVVYFEQAESWGGCFPLPTLKGAKIRVSATDAFGQKHKHTFWVPIVTLEDARRYNPSFGGTFATLRKTQEDNNKNPDS